MDIKLIALDLDGTTLTRNGLTRRTKETLEEAVARGYHVVVATGRVFSALPEKLLDIKGLEYIITSNGACITALNKGEIIYKDCIPENSIPVILGILSKTDYPVEVFTDGDAFIDRAVYEDLKEHGSTYMSPKYVLRTRKPVENIYEFLAEHKASIENINIHFEFFEDKEKMKKILESIDNVTITSSMAHNLEIGGKTTSKAGALKHLCSNINVELSQIIAFGDSPNDGAMLSAAGLSVAMGNATEDIKKIADIIAPTNDEEGVAYIIRSVLFKEKFEKHTFMGWLRKIKNPSGKRK